MKRILILLALATTFSACSKLNNKPNANFVELKGNLQLLEMSTFQYGTHIITEDQKTYALRSSVVDLKAYEGKTVKLKGTKIEGYPVENGPDFIDVTKIELSTKTQN
jgi:hypothetical protein